MDDDRSGAPYERNGIRWQHCDICEREGAADRHPCSFQRACSCWRGIPCDGTTRRASRRSR